MPRDGSIVLAWGDGDHRFRLPIGQLRELEEKRSGGLFELFDRMVRRTCRIDDIREIIRLGLIGGGIGQTDGMNAKAAMELVDRYLDDWPRQDSWAAAVRIIDAAITCEGGEQVGKDDAEAVAPQPNGASTSSASMEPAPRSASRRKRSTA